MTRILRQRLALFLSLLMTAFLFCQGMAQAAIVTAAIPIGQHESMSMGIDMSCHEASADAATKAPLTCPTDCQNIDKASDSSSLLLSGLSHVMPITAFILPSTADNTGAILRTALALIPPDPDPPAAIRFHRFRE